MLEEVVSGEFDTLESNSTALAELVNGRSHEGPLGSAVHAAVDDHRPVVFFSTEMGYLELTRRIVAAEAGSKSRLLPTGRIPEAETYDDDGTLAVGG